AAVLDAIKNVNALDDRKMLLEHILTILSNMPPGSIQNRVQNSVIEMLYNDLSHPPPTYLGDEYKYRKADGSFNNISDPNMGKAGTPYARSVQQQHPLPQNMLPDSGLVFDTLLKRDQFVKHPGGLSSMMFSFAALVIHTVFRTSHKDVSINETSSYVDLAPLYGHNEEALDKIRVRDGRGLLYPDTFAEDRLLLLPPAVCVLLVCFNRNHNYIASKLLEINEQKKWQDPDSIPASDPQRAQKIVQQEEEIFQTARLVNCGWFGGIVFSDYFGSILGLPRQGSSWSLNPFGEIRQEDHSLFERGRGNVCSVEFNCLYRWHATTSVEDEEWVTKLLGTIFKDKPLDQVTVQDFMMAAKKLQAEEPEVTHWTFGGMQRQEDNTFKDEELASIIKNATEHPASAFKARGTPHVMRLHEIMGIESNRRWGVCSLNEFRKFIGLKPYASFKEWNPDPEIAEAAERLYGDIENLELYVGLQAEEAKPLVEGAGLCPGYTISRAILSDAIALTRGDRFFTADFTPFNLTAWGFADCQRDVSGPGNGSMLGRLLLRTLPGEFTPRSTYTWFPLQTPGAMRGFLAELGAEAQYEYVRPTDPGAVAVARSYGEVEQVLKGKGFRAPYWAKTKGVVDGDGFFIAAEDVERGEREQREVLRVLAATPEAEDKIAQYFYDKTRALVAEKSYTLADKGTKNVDIVRDVLRYLPLHWVATELAGLSLKTDKDSSGVYTEAQLYDMLADCYSYFFLDADPAKAMHLEDRVKEHIKDLKFHIKATLVMNAGGRMSIAAWMGTLQNLFLSSKQKKAYRAPFVETLFARGGTADEVANNILALLIGATVEFSQCLVNVVNYYVDQKGVDLADKKNADKLSGYVYEALSACVLGIDPPFRGVYRESLEDQTIGSLSVKRGTRVFADIASASQDADVFPKPSDVSTTREPKERYLTGDGVARYAFSSKHISELIINQVLVAVFEQPNLRRAPGLSGTLKRYKTQAENTQRWEYLGQDQLPTAWPTTMVLQVRRFFFLFGEVWNLMSVRCGSMIRRWSLSMVLSA
ncbi:linoleate diol synthase, partial [Dentipellis sp. KUC8613]